MIKNEQYFKDKAEVIIDGIIDVAKHEKLLPVVGMPRTCLEVQDKVKFLEFKIWQLQALGSIAASPVEKIWESYEKEYAALCDSCKQTFLDGDMSCDKEVKRFIMAMMCFRGVTRT